MTVDYIDCDNGDDEYIDIDSDTDSSFTGLMSDDHGVLGEDTDIYKDEIQDEDSGYGEEENSHRNRQYSQCAAYRADNSVDDQKNDADCRFTGYDGEAISYDHVLFGNYGEEEANDDQGDDDGYEEDFGDFIVDEIGEEVEGGGLEERLEDQNDLIFEGFISDGEEADI